MWRLKPKPELAIDAVVVVDIAGRDEPAVRGLLDELRRAARGLPLVLLADREPDEFQRAERIAARSAGQRIRVAPADGFIAALRDAIDGGAPHVAWIGRQTGPVGEDWLREAAGLLAGIEDAVVAGGRVVARDKRVLWAGGYFGVNGFLDCPDFGRPADDAGYHGMAHCQRSVDGVASVHWIACSGFLAEVIDACGNEIGPAALCAALALRAAQTGRRVVYTPFSTVTTEAEIVRPAVPDAGLLRRLGVTLPATSRYYNRQLSRDAGSYWLPAYQVCAA